MPIDLKNIKLYGKDYKEEQIINIEKLQNKNQEPNKKEEISGLIADINEKEYKKPVLVNKLLSIIEKHYKNIDYLDTL